MIQPTISGNQLEQHEGEILHRSVYLETFGCQMNELDSELVRDSLHALGYRFTENTNEAQILLYNTCSVREQAENKVLSRVGILGKEKEKGRSVVVGLLGCLAEREGEALLSKYPQVDFLCGPGELDRLPQLLENSFAEYQVDRSDRMALQGNTARRMSTLSMAQDSLERLDLSRAYDPSGFGAAGRSAYVRITRGCNKFCTYCVVPNTRGPEVHRSPGAILEECKKLADIGVLEVTLLGQTVNHYRYTHGITVDKKSGCEMPQIGPGLSAFRKPIEENQSVTTFAQLLKRIHDEVPAIKRLRFVTSYPRDFTDEALRVIAQSPRICPYLHVPAQSGSDSVLKRMNRGYTSGEYRLFAERALKLVPNLSLAGDFIVGFCGETKDEFEETCDLVRSLPFKNNFIFKYSTRPGTAAKTRYKDDVPELEKRQRLNQLLEIQAESSDLVHKSFIGKEVSVLVEGESPAKHRNKGNVDVRWEPPQVQLRGRTMGDLITAFQVEKEQASSLIGTIQRVKIFDSSPLLLHGKLSI